MKKVIIALLVVLSVFALVSCSSNVTPTVTAEAVTLNNETVGVSNVWSTKLAHNTSKYGVWYHDASGKYIDVLTTGMALENAAGEKIGTLTTSVKAVERQGSASEGNPQYGGTIYVYDEVAIGVTAGGKAGTWTGELVVATKAISDTELSDVVAKYNVTYTNTVDAVKTYDLGAIKLASGGDYETADATQVVAYAKDGSAVSVKGIFEILSGGYKYVGAVDGGADDYIALGDDEVGTGSSAKALAQVKVVTDNSISGHIGYKFTLLDNRANELSYKQFIDYSYAAKNYVIADSETNMTGDTVIKGEPIVSFTLAADMPAVKEFIADYDSTTPLLLEDIEVSAVDEHVGLFVVEKGHYVDLNDYYVGEPEKEGLAVGRIMSVTEASSSQLVRTLTISFKREDAEGELETKTLAKIAETLDAKICSYTDYTDEKTYTELASLEIYFENEAAYEYQLASFGGDYADYWLNDDEMLDADYCFLYDKSLSENNWVAGVEDTDNDGNATLSFDVDIDSHKCTLVATFYNIGSGYVRFTLETPSAAAGTEYDDVYVKFTDEAADTVPLRQSVSASHKLHFDCISKYVAD